MTDRRPLISYAVIAAFMAVTVAHVAIYAGSFEPDGWRAVGWFYALAVDASIAVCAWLTRWEATQVMAWVGFFAFTLASGALNIAQVRPWEYEAFAWIYALFPTAAIALLGFLARDAGELARRAEASRKGAETRKANKLALLEEQQIEQEPEPELPAEPEPEQGNGHKDSTCPYCLQGFATYQAVNAHLRFCSEREKEREVAT